jgi:SAM-dependent methyltransferase
VAPGAHYVRLDLDAGSRPAVVGRAEAIPFRNGCFDAVLCTQLWGLLERPDRFAAEISRVTRPGARVWVSGPAAWPYDSARTEHRFGEPELAILFGGLGRVRIVSQGGMLGIPFAVLNLVVREAVVVAERRLGPVARVLRPAAGGLHVLANLAGRALETLASRGPLARFLGYLDGRMPTNFLVVAEKLP